MGTRVALSPLATPPGHKLLFTSRPGGHGGCSSQSGHCLGGDSSGSRERGKSRTQDWEGKVIGGRGVATLAMAGGLCLSPVGESPTSLCPGGRVGQAGWLGGTTFSTVSSVLCKLLACPHSHPPGTVSWEAGTGQRAIAAPGDSHSPRW